jgi:hypothetical protein
MIQNIIFESIEFLIGYPALLQFLKLGLAMIVDRLINNYEVQPMIDYWKNNLNLKLTDEQCEQLECELETIARESKNGNPIDQFTFDTTAQALSPWQGDHHSCSYHHLLHDSTHNFRKHRIPHRLSSPLAVLGTNKRVRHAK